MSHAGGAQEGTGIMFTTNPEALFTKDRDAYFYKLIGRWPRKTTPQSFEPATQRLQAHVGSSPQRAAEACARSPAPV